MCKNNEEKWSPLARENGNVQPAPVANKNTPFLISLFPSACAHRKKYICVFISSFENKLSFPFIVVRQEKWQSFFRDIIYSSYPQELIPCSGHGIRDSKIFDDNVDGNVACKYISLHPRKSFEIFQPVILLFCGVIVAFAVVLVTVS